MLVRQFVYGLRIKYGPNGPPVCELVRQLQDLIDAHGLWGSVEGLSHVTGLPRGLVEDIIAVGSVYCA